MPFDKIMGKFSPSQIPEIEKWIAEGALDGTIQTVCDVRRHVESILGEGKLTNEEIIDGIIQTGGAFTNRPESDTGDICYVNLDELLQQLSKKQNQ